MKYLLSSIVVILMGCSNVPTNIQNNQCRNSSISTGDTTIYIYGDSVSHGMILDCQGNPSSWTTISAQALNMQYVMNAVPGSDMTYPNQYEQLMKDEWPKGSIVIFSPGINDASRHANDRVYMDQYYQDMLNILNRLHGIGIKTYIGTPLIVLNPIPGTSVLKQYADLNEEAVITIKDSNIKFIDLFDNYNPTPATNIDVVHPGNLGNQLLSNYFLANV